MTAKTATTVLSIRKFPPDLHKRIKLVATAAGKSVQDYVTEILEKYVPTASAAARG